MKRLHLSRRSVLRGAGISVALPWLEAMTSLGRRARAAAPKRFVVMFSPNGCPQGGWTPTGAETTFTFGPALAPLETVKGDVVILDGIDNVAASKGPGDDHMRGMGSMLTATELLPGTNRGANGRTPAGLAGGISLDQQIVRGLKPTTKFPSLEIGVQARSQGTVWGYSNYRSANQPLPLDNSTGSVFSRVFGDSAAGGGEEAVLRLRANRKSVLDAVIGSYKLLNSSLGTEDRRKLEAHLTTVEDLEKRLLTTNPAMPVKACARPQEAAITDEVNDNFPQVGKLQMDQLLMALACNLTRVGTIQWSCSVGLTRFTWLGATRAHHDLSHDPDSNTATKAMLTKINSWYAEQFAYFVKRLKQMPEEGGTMLDNTLVLWANELARGNAHSHTNMPYVLAGRAGGRLKTGRFLQFPRASNNDLFVSILNAFDLPDTSFGNPAYCTGPLAGLVS